MKIMQIMILKIDTLNHKTKLQHAEFSLLGDGGVPSIPLTENLLISLLQAKSQTKVLSPHDLMILFIKWDWVQKKKNNFCKPF